jgi:hypothetical protein
MRVFWAALFWIWGFLGLLFFIIDSSLGGTGAHTDGELLWIGGMVLFGLSALMCRPWIKDR